jgi:hypothetical protein
METDSRKYLPKRIFHEGIDGTKKRVITDSARIKTRDMMSTGFMNFLMAFTIPQRKAQRGASRKDEAPGS